jgi:surface polysaccharide O-acyltransferase-like enzyme
MAAAFSPMDWAHAGPFFIQTSRALHYLVYFVIGVGMGAAGLGRGLLAPDAKLARRWPIWVVASLAAYGFGIAMVITIMSGMAKGAPSAGLLTLGNLSFVLGCAASSFAFLALFVRFGRWSGTASTSLAANAYGIYLLHYACVSWLQWSLLPTDLPALAKALLVFLGAVLVSWGLSAALRRIPAVARVV